MSVCMDFFCPVRYEAEKPAGDSNTILSSGRKSLIKEKLVKGSPEVSLDGSHDDESDDRIRTILEIRDHEGRERRRHSIVPSTASIIEDPFLEGVCEDAELEPVQGADRLSRNDRKRIVKSIARQVIDRRSQSSSLSGSGGAGRMQTVASMVLEGVQVRNMARAFGSPAGSQAPTNCSSFVEGDDNIPNLESNDAVISYISSKYNQSQVRLGASGRTSRSSISRPASFTSRPGTAPGTGSARQSWVRMTNRVSAMTAGGSQPGRSDSSLISSCTSDDSGATSDRSLGIAGAESSTVYHDRSAVGDNPNSDEMYERRLEQYRRSTINGLRKGSILPDTVLVSTTGRGSTPAEVPDLKMSESIIASGTAYARNSSASDGTRLSCDYSNRNSSAFRHSSAFSTIDPTTPNGVSISLSPITSEQSNANRTSGNSARRTKTTIGSDLLDIDNNSNFYSQIDDAYLNGGMSMDSVNSSGNGGSSTAHQILSGIMSSDSEMLRSKIGNSSSRASSVQFSAMDLGASIQERQSQVRRSSICSRAKTEAPKPTANGVSAYPLPGSNIPTQIGGTFNTTKSANNLISEEDILNEIAAARRESIANLKKHQKKSLVG